MESVEKNISVRGKELRGPVPSVVQPLELSRRVDSSLPMLRGDTEVAKKVTSDGKTEAERPTLAVIDRKLVDEAARWISAKLAATLKVGAQEVGEYVLDRFFRNEPVLARSRNPHKNASFRALADKCGTPELPISKSWLNNAVGVALMIRQLPETAKVFKELLPSYQNALLPLRDPERVERVAKHAVTKELSLRELHQAVAEEQAKIPKAESRGRAPTPVVVRTLNRSLKLFAFEAGKRSFTKADVEELDHEQRKNAIQSTEGLIEKLKDLLRKLKKT